MGLPLAASSRTRKMRGECSATESELSKASSTGTTPKDHARKLTFNTETDVPTAEGRWPNASWDLYERKKRPRDGEEDEDDGAGTGI
eukprot:7391876-Prymnesium_polylepis.5